MTSTPKISPSDVLTYCQDLLPTDVHAKRVLSIAGAVTGVLHAASLAIHAIGLGLAVAEGKNSKHCIKQVDRLLSNPKFKVDPMFASWLAFVLSEREEVVVALDWTDFDDDDHTTLALHLVTSHGRSTPLIWKTHQKSLLRDHRTQWEEELVYSFIEKVPTSLKVTLLADRGFGSQDFYQFLRLHCIHFVIRFRGNVRVTDAHGVQHAANDLVMSGGRSHMIRDAYVTEDLTPVAAVVVVKAEKMKAPWCLATSRADYAAADVIKLYAKRFTIEETFRDQKDARFGFGLSQTSIGDCARRDRLLFIATLAQALLTLLGAAAEHAKLDRLMKANTSKKRTHSLLRQGLMWYASIPNMPEERLRLLMQSFAEILAQHAVMREIFGAI